MKGSIGTATYLSYTRPYWGKVISRLNYIEKLSPNEKSIKGRQRFQGKWQYPLAAPSAFCATVALRDERASLS